jgi:hypothetical protein
MADEQKKPEDAEELDIAPPRSEEEEQPRDRGRQPNDMPREDADQDAQSRQAGDGNVHLGSQRDPAAETAEARRTSTFDSQDTLEAISRDAAQQDTIDGGARGENVTFDGAIARGERRSADGDGDATRGDDGARAVRGGEANATV